MIYSQELSSADFFCASDGIAIYHKILVKNLILLIYHCADTLMFRQMRYQ